MLTSLAQCAANHDLLSLQPFPHLAWLSRLSVQEIQWPAFFLEGKVVVVANVSLSP